MSNNVSWLTTVPASDLNFKAALGRASLPELKGALAIRGKARSKSAFAAIRSEIKRFYKEQGVDVYKLPTFDDFTPEGIAAQERDRDQEILHHRRLLSMGNLTASRSIAECRLSTEQGNPNFDEPRRGDQPASEQTRRPEASHSATHGAEPRASHTNAELTVAGLNPAGSKSSPDRARSARSTPTQNQPMKQPSLVNIPPSELQLHPVLEGIPELPPAQFESLKGSIAEMGLMEPLFAIKENGALLVFSGRHRRRAAIELELDTIPVLVRDDIDPLSHAIESAATGRQLTGNRLAERVLLDSRLMESDVSKILSRRVKFAAGALPMALRITMDKAANYGRFAFVRDVCTRVNERADGEPVTLELFATAVAEEVKSR